MLYLKSTAVTKAPGIYEVDVAAKPPGKTYGIFMAIDPDNQPAELLKALDDFGFKNTYQSRYTHKDKGKVMDMHFHKPGTDLFQGWKDNEREENMKEIHRLFAEIGITIVPRVMTLAEAYA